MSGTAILNAFGRVLGDTLIGYQALHAALEEGAVTDPVAFRLPGLGAIVDDLHAAAAFCPTRDLPWDQAGRDRPFPGAAGFARVIDCRDLAFDPDYLAHHDLGRYFLERLGLDPRSVPPASRRIGWLRPHVAPTPPPGLPPRFILVCPSSAMPLRTMPDDVHTLLCDVAAAFAPVLTQGDPPGTARCAEPAADLDQLCGLVVAARLVISTDTAMVHLADAMDVPCVAFFPTHDPALRIAHYPRCLGVRLPTALPPNLEFARSDADVAAAHAAWRQPDLDADGLAALIGHALLSL